MNLPMAQARAALLDVRPHERPAVLEELFPRMAPHWWLKLVGDFWSRCDGKREMLAALMRSVPDWRVLMGRVERTTWAHLPETFIAWRGCYQDMNEGGLSYSVQEQQARAYPFMGRYREEQANPVLIAAEIRRAACAVKIEMGVMEVLASSPIILQVQPLRFRPAPLSFEPLAPLAGPLITCPTCGLSAATSAPHG